MLVAEHVRQFGVEHLKQVPLEEALVEYGAIQVKHPPVFVLHIWQGLEQTEQVLFALRL